MSKYFIEISRKCESWADGSASQIVDSDLMNSKGLMRPAIRGAIKAGFVMGLEEGIRTYAIWKDGTQVVGCLETPLKEVLKEVRSVFEIEQ